MHESRIFKGVEQIYVVIFKKLNNHELINSFGFGVY